MGTSGWAAGAIPSTGPLNWKMTAGGNCVSSARKGSRSRRRRAGSCCTLSMGEVRKRTTRATRRRASRPGGRFRSPVSLRELARTPRPPSRPPPLPLKTMIKSRVEVDEALRKKREQAVLDALWKKKDQREGTMWRKSESGVPSSRLQYAVAEASRSFNTARRKISRRRLQNIAEEREKRKRSPASCRIARCRGEGEGPEAPRGGREGLTADAPHGEDDSEDEATEAKEADEDRKGGGPIRGRV